MDGIGAADVGAAGLGKTENRPFPDARSGKSRQSKQSQFQPTDASMLFIYIRCLQHFCQPGVASRFFSTE
jgi:hypothetical protein